MNDQFTERRSSLLIIFLLSISIISTESLSSSTDSFIFAGCSQLKYNPESTYTSNLNLLLTSLLTSAATLSYNNYTVVGSASQTTIFGLFQCRGDLDPTTCRQCVANSVSQLGTLCPNSCGGALQLDGCFVKYDTVNFFGVEDKTVVVKKCGPPMNMMSGFDAVMVSLGSGGGAYRASGWGDFRGVAQCVGDLSASQCQDCLSMAIRELRVECGASSSGDMFLAKCYARFSGGRSESTSDHGKDGNGIDKTLAIAITMVAGIVFLIMFISWYLRQCEKRKG